MRGRGGAIRLSVVGTIAIPVGLAGRKVVGESLVRMGDDKVGWFAGEDDGEEIGRAHV